MNFAISKMNRTKLSEINNRNDPDFQKIVLENLDHFDSHDFGMFFNLIRLIPRELEKDMWFYQRVYEKTKELDCDTLSLMTSTRVYVFNELMKIIK